jgi:hypothetical protein
MKPKPPHTHTLFLLSLTFSLTFLTQTIHSVEGHHFEKFFYIQGGPKYMYYFATFDVGTPEKLQSVIIDTGSDTMAFPCETCHGKNCGSHQYPRFSPEGSRTFKYKIRCTNPQYIGGHQVCKFVKSYAEGSSLYGFLADDLIRFKNAKKIYGNKLADLNRKLVKDIRLQTEFGCTEKETGLFKTQYADGILGLDDQSEFINSLEQLNGSGSKVFSFGLCFHEHGGIMSIDLRNRYGVDDKIRMLNKDISEYSKPLVIPYDNSNMYYEIPLYGFSLGNDRVNLDVPATIMIDSGTTFSHFPNIIMRQILRELNKWCSKSPSRCGKIPNAVFKEDSCLELRPPDENFANEGELLNTFPDFHLYLGQRRSYKLRPKNYFYKEYLEDPKERRSGLVRLCMAIKGHNDDKIILGAFSMVDHYFYFDRKSQKLKIFRENCYLRTKNLLVKKRILSAEKKGDLLQARVENNISIAIPEDAHKMENNADDEIINLTIPKKRILKAKVNKKRKLKKRSRHVMSRSPAPRELMLTDVNKSYEKVEKAETAKHHKRRHKLAMFEATIGDKLSFYICILLIIGIIYQLMKQRRQRLKEEKNELNKSLTEKSSEEVTRASEKEECLTEAEGEMTPSEMTEELSVEAEVKKVEKVQEEEGEQGEATEEDVTIEI